MKTEDLKNAVGKIRLDEKEKQRMIKELKAKYEAEKVIKPELPVPHRAKKEQRIEQKEANWHTSRMKAAAVFIICVTAAGALSIPARALVSSYVKEHMEEVPEKELQELVEQIDNQETEADDYSREYTDGEKKRLEALYQQYYDGNFPEGEIRQVGSREEAAEYEFCFLTTASVYYLPANRELTDEELLQIIDFDQKRNYSLRQRYEEEYAGEIAAKQEKLVQMAENGAVTEQEAVDIAATYLKQIYGLDDSGMEGNAYLDSEASMFGVQNYYCVNWSDRGVEKYYYFYIDTASGCLLEAECSGGPEEAKALRPSASDAPDRMTGIVEQAERFLEDVMKISEQYSEVECSYLVSDNEGLSQSVNIIFIKEDGSAYSINCLWDGSLQRYRIDTQKDYEKRMADLMAYYEKKKADGEASAEVVRILVH